MILFVYVVDDEFLKVLCTQVVDNDDFEVSLIPVSVSYEFFPIHGMDHDKKRSLNQRTPHVRVNFGHAHSLKVIKVLFLNLTNNIVPFYSK